jgi:alpha-L-fucosidase
MYRMDRRSFIQKTTAGSAGLCLTTLWQACSRKAALVPTYLHDHAKIYLENPKKAALEWFNQARFGMFIHYGLYSLLGRHEWVLYDEKIPIAEYDKLVEQFTAENFDAEFITDLALEAEMSYITLVTKHCDSFCLWDTSCTKFNSMNSPAASDLVGKMARACERKGLGLFLFYEHGFDWRHPHGPSPWDWKIPAVRPQYDAPEPFYKYDDEYDLQVYLDYVECGIRELLTGYGPVAGIWLDGIAVPLSGDPAKFKCDELYTLIRNLQPQALISYKYGLLGTEDFMAPEEVQLELETVEIDNPHDKKWEICSSLHDGGSTKHKVGWGYVKDSRHLKPDEVMEKLRFALSKEANLLLNTGPLPDGSIHPEDIKTLREVGKRIREYGWPELVGEF